MLLTFSEYGSSPEETLILDWSVDFDLQKKLGIGVREGEKMSGVALTSLQMIMQTN